MTPARETFPPQHKADSQCDGERFTTAAEAWMWAIQARQALMDGARVVAGAGDVPRPCEPLDLLCAADRLLRDRRLAAAHIRCLLEFGRLQRPPDARISAERRDARLWDEAMDALTTLLCRKGIVAPLPPRTPMADRPESAAPVSSPPACRPWR